MMLMLVALAKTVAASQHKRWLKVCDTDSDITCDQASLIFFVAAGRYA